MSSKSTENNKEWSSEPADLGETVNRRHRKGAASMNNHSDEHRFVAVYSSMSAERGDLPSEVLEYLNKRGGVSSYNFVDKANPFYKHDTSMIAIREQEAETATNAIRDMGYNVEYRDDKSQFKFTPRPTVGEIVIKRVNINAPLEE